MSAPDWPIWLTLATSVLAGSIVSMIVSTRSIAKGEGLVREWVKRSLYGGLAMIAVWAAYFIIGNIVAAIYN